MKLKGISVFEQHADKIALGVFGAFLLVVLLFQVGLVGGSRSVKVGNQEVALDRAGALVRDRAGQRLSKLNAETVAEGIPSSLPSAKETFEVVMAQAERPAVSLAAALGSEGVVGTGGLKGGEGAPIASGGEVGPASPIRPPAPTVPVAWVHEGTLDPVEVERVGGDLAKVLPREQPYDLRAVTVQAGFDAGGLRQMLTGAGGGPAVPEALWRGRVELLDVELVRERRQADGSWGDRRVIGPAPGRATVREVVQGQTFEAGQLQALLDRERLGRGEIRRPAFYATIAGDAWVWPARAMERAARRGDAGQVSRLVRELAELRREIKALTDRMNKPVDGPGAPGDERPRGPAGPGGGGGGGGFVQAPTVPGRVPMPRTWLAQARPGGGGGGQPGGPGGPGAPGAPGGERAPGAPGSRPDPEAATRERLQKELSNKQAREKVIIDELAGLGVDETGKRLEAGAEPAFAEALESLTVPTDAPVTLWSHDLTAEAGGVYRYAVRVWVTNPYFDQADRLADEHKASAQAVAVSSELSGWSEVVEIQPRTVAFITSAGEGTTGPIGGLSRATVELFEFYYGYWRRAAVSATPGDAIGASVELPELSTFAVTRGQGGQVSVGEATALARSRSVDAGLFLLDVALGVGDGAAKVFLADASGRVVVRRPTGELGDDPVRRRLSESASAGATAKIRTPGASGDRQDQAVPAGGREGGDDGREGGAPAAPAQPGGPRRGPGGGGGGGG